MNITVFPGRLSGKTAAIGSKSHAHRLLIMSALCRSSTRVVCNKPCDDVLSTVDCLNALCADITKSGDEFIVAPRSPSDTARLYIAESASTYRFMLPLAAALGVKTEFTLGEGLARRPVKPLIEALASHGAGFDGFRLLSGDYFIPGNISSQFISGLCMALPLLKDSSVIKIQDGLQSRGYVEMTLDALKRFGISERFEDNSIYISGGERFISPRAISAEGDWSSSAMFLCAAAASSGEISITGLSASSHQPDRAVVDILKSMGARVYWDGEYIRAVGGKLEGREIDVSETPDLACALAVAAVAAAGETALTGAKRLRYKESDRVDSIVTALNQIGACAVSRGDDIIIKGAGEISGGVADAAGDHRIAMMLGCLATLSCGPVTILGAQAVAKSYPSFYGDLRSLGMEIREESL